MTRRLLREQQGASTVVVALCMSVLLIVVALVVDIGATAIRKSQLQDAADAAALSIAQRCYDAFEAESDYTDELDGCAGSVLTPATAEAQSIATAHLNNPADPLTVQVEPPGLHTVTVNLLSGQDALFAISSGTTEVSASATAEWRLPAIPLPLAMNACTLEKFDPDELAFAGVGLYDGVGTLLDSVLSLVELLGGDEDLPGFLESVLGCGLNVAAGGWVTSAGSDCTYDPGLLVTVTAVLDRLLPVGACTALIESGLIGKRIIVPVYENATPQLVGQLIGTAPIVRYAEIVVTGYELSTLANPQYAYRDFVDPSCRTSLSELLGLDAGVSGKIDQIKNAIASMSGPLGALIGPVLALVSSIVGAVVDAALLGVVDTALKGLTRVLGLCQGIQGYVVDHDLSAEEAAAALVPYRLVA